MKKIMNCIKNIKKLAEKEDKVIFGGRLATYKYYDMHQVIGAALRAVEKEFNISLLKD